MDVALTLSSGVDWKTAMRACEESIFARIPAISKAAWESLQEAFYDQGVEVLLQHMRDRHAPIAVGEGEL